MRINVEFDSWEEMELFRTSGKKTRGKSQTNDEPTVEEVAEKQAQIVAQPAPAQAAAANPVPPQTFQPPAAQQSSGFPGANGPTPPAADKVVTAIIARIDGAVNSGQSTDAIVNWFRQQIGPDAANATLDQIRNVLIPRMSKAQLDQMAPHLGISRD